MLPHELIKELVDRAGGESAVARAMGDIKFQGTLYKFANGMTASPRRETAERVARHFGIPTEAIYDESAATAEARRRGLLPGEPAEAGDVLEYGGQPKHQRPVRVIGTARLGTDGYYEQLDEPDGYVPGFSSHPDAYALKVKGDSMHPSIRHGWYVIVNPAGQCRPGRFVAIALADGRKMVKELVFERPNEVVVESVNGNCRMTIERQEVEQMHHVMAVVSPDDWEPM